MNKKIIYVLFLFIFLSGCRQEFDDISYFPEYKNMIGKKYKVVKELNIYAITAENNYEDVIDHYAIAESPGLGGPEIIFEKKLPSAVVVKILKVLKCGNCFFGDFVVVVVDVKLDQIDSRVPVMIYRLLSSESNGNFILDNNYFSEI